VLYVFIILFTIKNGMHGAITFLNLQLFYFFSYLSELKLRMPRLAFKLEQKDEKIQRCKEAIWAVCDNICNRINEVIKGEQRQQ